MEVYQMNSVLIPAVTGKIVINYKGGDIKMEQNSSLLTEEDVKDLPVRELRKLEIKATQEYKELQEEGDKCQFFFGGEKRVFSDKRELFKVIKGAKARIAQQRNIVRKFLAQKRRIPRIPVETGTGISSRILCSKTSMIRRSELTFYEIRRGDNLQNKIVDDSFTDEFGEFHERISKECIVPYTREESSLKMKDLVILHKSGRLAIGLGGNPTQTLSGDFPDREDELEELFRAYLRNGFDFFVILPKGGRRNRAEYGAVPMPNTPYHNNGNKFIPLNNVVRKVLLPKIDGRNPQAVEYINRFMGPNTGYGPVYEYDEFERMRNFTPDLLSYNQVEYGDKFIILIGTPQRISSIERRINSFNKIENGYHRFTNELVIYYNGQTSRCSNKRVVISDDGKVQVFGLNLKGTPEENLKGYLRSFDRVPFKKDTQEAQELLEVAEKQDGRQNLLNLEYDLRSELKYLRTRSSKELYSLILSVEEELNGAPSKKEQALLNVLESFKSTKDIHEQEGKGLTSDIEDLVTIEKNSSDERFKRSKNLFNQKLGILNRNQNPLRMEGEVEPLRTWKGRGGPISIPTNEVLPKRNIPFVQRTPVDIKGVNGTMFSRDFVVFTTSRPTRKSTYNPTGAKRIVKNHNKVRNMIERVLNHPLNLVEVQEEPETIAVKFGEPRVQATVIGFPVPLPSKKYRRVGEKLVRVEYKARTGMFARKFYYKKLVVQHVSHRETLRRKRGRTSPLQRYCANNGQVSTERYFDDRLNPGVVYKTMTWKQFKASEMKPYQFSGRIVFDEKKHEFVRIPHNKPSSYKILHTIGDGKNDVDYYIIEVNGRRLYAKGDVTLLDNPAGTISFTGTRQPSDLTKKFVKETVRMFLEDDDYVTVGGGAEGCDTLMHHQTIQKGGKTIMVLAGGFNQWFKKGQIKPEMVLKNGGLILSEHEPDYKPSRGDFVMRNWVIADLSERLVVFEAGKGTTHCANFGAELGKELLIQPGTKTSTDLISRLKGVPFYPLEGYYPF